MGTTTTSELWATEDVKVDPGIVRKFMASLFLKQQSTKDLAAQLLKEYEKIKGFVVYSVATSTIMGKETRSTSEVREVKESATAPAGTYEVPAKYTMKKWK
jgi:predicted hydrolase (HD superfamily)